MNKKIKHKSVAVLLRAVFSPTAFADMTSPVKMIAKLLFFMVFLKSVSLIVSGKKDFFYRLGKTKNVVNLGNRCTSQV